MNYVFYVMGFAVVIFLVFVINELTKKVKGNIVKDQKIYYTPDHRLYKSVKPEVMFRSVKAAEKAGFRKPKR